MVFDMIESVFKKRVVKETFSKKRVVKKKFLIIGA